MRYLAGLVLALALGVMGCSETAGTGGSGGAAGMGGDGGTGGMPECLSPEDCDDGEECTTDACASGICENMAVEDGTVCDESNECAAGQCASGACELTPVTNGTACGDDAGTCQDGSCEVACTEQGINNAIAVGGGPYTFDCAAGTTMVTAAEIVIDNDVILDGEGNLTVDGDEEHRVFSVPEGVTAELRGVTVTKGTVVEVAPNGEESGGGILNDGKFMLVNSTVSSNARGGINNTGTMTVTNSTVSNNAVGGIRDSGTLTLTNSTVSGNSGGGIESFSGTLTLTDSTISGNTKGTAGDGAGIYKGSGTLTLTNSTVSGNTSETNAGGISKSGSGGLMLTDSTVSGNTAKGHGGGIVNCCGGTVTVTNSTVSGNTAEEHGGGIELHLGSGALTLTNSTVSGNSPDGFWSQHEGVALTIVNSTVSENGGVPGYAFGDITNLREGALILTNSLVDGDCFTEGNATITSNGYNIESPGDTCGFDQAGDQSGVTVEQLNLGPLRDKGGATETHALGPGSVAIDQIPEADCVDADGKPLKTDQCGEPRPAGAESKCDVGAFEVQP